MRRFILGIAAATLFTGPAIADDLAEDQLREVLIEFSDLRAPKGAQFRKLVHSNLSYPAWCGEINAQNGFGGYVGWQKFAVRDTRKGEPRNPSKFVEILIDDEDGTLTTTIRRACQRDRILRREDW